MFSGCFLNACLRQSRHVLMACMAPVVNVRGPLFVHPKGIVRRTTFHVLRMYSDLLEPEVVDAHTTSDSITVGDNEFQCVDAVLTRSADGKRLAAAVVNRHPSEAARIVLKLGEKPLPPQIAATVLTGDSPDAYNDIARPNRVTPRKQPLSLRNGTPEVAPHSISILQWTV